MDRFESISVLVCAVDQGSLSAASRTLGMPIATVSRKVSELEAHLNTRLLMRSTRKLELTDAGRAYVASVRHILEDLEEADRAASGEYMAPKGELLVTAPFLLGRTHLAPIAAEFLKAYPDVDLRLLLGDRSGNLIEEHIDLAIRIGELPDSDLIAVRVGTASQVICGSPAYFKAHGMPTHPEQLAAHACITFDTLAAPDAWRFGTGKSEFSVKIHSRLTVNSADLAITAAAAGLGITRVLSYQVAEALRARSLKVALQGFERPPQPIHAVYAGQGRIPIKLRAFIDFAVPRLKDKLSRT